MSANNTKIAVASRSFSQDKHLRDLLTQKYNNVRFNETGLSLKSNELIEFLSGAEKAIVALEEIDETIIKNLPELKLISKYGVGLNNINFEHLFKYGIQLAWEGGVNRRSVAELALHFILGCVRGSFNSHHDVLKNKWEQFKGQNLSNKTLGILGLGHVGQELVPFLKPFNLKILAYDIHDKSDFCKNNNIEQVGLDQLLKQSDVVTLHLPLTSKTKNILSEENLSLLKQGSFLINTARGGLVDEAYLYTLLTEKKLASAAFDVFQTEPPLNNKLLNLDNFYSTAHIGGSSLQSIHAMGEAAIHGLENGKDAKPENFFSYPL